MTSILFEALVCSGLWLALERGMRIGPLTVSLRKRGGKMDGRVRDRCSVATTHEVGREPRRRSRPAQSWVGYLATSLRTVVMLRIVVGAPPVTLVRSIPKRGDSLSLPRMSQYASRPANSNLSVSVLNPSRLRRNSKSAASGKKITYTDWSAENGSLELTPFGGHLIS